MSANCAPKRPWRGEFNAIQYYCAYIEFGVITKPKRLIASSNIIRSLLETKATMYDTLIPLCIFQFLTFYYGNKLYRIDEKICVDVPSIEEQSGPTLVVAETSFLPGTLPGGNRPGAGGASLERGGYGGLVANDGSFGDVEMVARVEIGDNYNNNTDNNNDNNNQPIPSSPYAKPEGTIADITQAQPVALDFSNPDFFNSFQSSHFTTECAIQPGTISGTGSGSGSGTGRGTEV